MNWTKVGTVVGALLFVTRIVTITVGPKTCPHRHVPFICLLTQFFGR